MRILLTIIGFVLSVPLVLAHDSDAPHVEEATTLLDQILHLNLFDIALWSFVVVMVLAGLAAIIRPKTEGLKKFFFWSIALFSILVTVAFLAQTTIKNIVSETGGPVHWHADFEIWDCGEELDLLNPTGLLNRIGTPSVHEHNDKRIHIEGTLIEKKEASLGAFFEVIGGELNHYKMVVPTNDGVVERTTGESCSDGTEAEVQVFLWKVDTEGEVDVANQEKLSDFEDYVLSPYTYVPEGDCLIIEFGEIKDRTDHVCEQYEVAESKGELIINR